MTDASPTFPQLDPETREQLWRQVGQVIEHHTRQACSHHLARAVAVPV